MEAFELILATSGFQRAPNIGRARLFSCIRPPPELNSWHRVLEQNAVSISHRGGYEPTSKLNTFRTKRFICAQNTGIYTNDIYPLSHNWDAPLWLYIAPRASRKQPISRHALSLEAAANGTHGPRTQRTQRKRTRSARGLRSKAGLHRPGAALAREAGIPVTEHPLCATNR